MCKLVPSIVVACFLPREINRNPVTFLKGGGGGWRGPGGGGGGGHLPHNVYQLCQVQAGKIPKVHIVDLFPVFCLPFDLGTINLAASVVV